MIETLCLPTFHRLGQNSVLPTVQQTTIKTTKLTTQKLIRNLQLKIVPTKNLGLFFSIQMCVTVKTQYTLLMFITSLKSMAWSLKIKYYQSNIAKHKARSVFTPTQQLNVTPSPLPKWQNMTGTLLSNSAIQTKPFCTRILDFPLLFFFPPSKSFF